MCMYIWTQHCWMLHISSVCRPCYMVLNVVACCSELLRKFWKRLNSLRASSPIWASEVSRKRASERRSREAPRSRILARLTSLAQIGELTRRLPVKLLSQQLPIFLLCRDRRRVAQQCWIRLHCSSNIVGATNAYYTWSPRSNGAYPSHDTLQVLTLLGVVASVCTPLSTRTQQRPTLLGQQCWELFIPLHVDLHCYAGW